MNIAIIPARGQSKGLKRKNVKLLHNKPLIAYTIEAALKSKYVDRVIVSTEDEEIAKISLAYEAEVPFLRPMDLATDTAATTDVILHVIDSVEKEEGLQIDNVLLLQPTSPLRTEQHIDSAYEKYINEDAESLQSVCLAKTHPYLTRVINQGVLVDAFNIKEISSRRQDLPDIYELNGAIYIFKNELIKKTKNIVGERNIPFVMTQHESVDIDDIYDFFFVETLLKYQS